MIDVLKQAFMKVMPSAENREEGQLPGSNTPRPSCPLSRLRHLFKPGSPSEDQALVQVRGERGGRYGEE